MMCFCGIFVNTKVYNLIAHIINDKDLKIKWRDDIDIDEVREFNVLFESTLTRVYFYDRLCLCISDDYHFNGLNLEKDSRFEDEFIQYNQLCESITEDLKKLVKFTHNKFDSDFEMLLAFTIYIDEIDFEPVTECGIYHIDLLERNVRNKIHEVQEQEHNSNFKNLMSNLEVKYPIVFGIFEFMGYLGFSLLVILILVQIIMLCY